jgi:hypothetical protein
MIWCEPLEARGGSFHQKNAPTNIIKEKNEEDYEKERNEMIGKLV